MAGMDPKRDSKKEFGAWLRQCREKAGLDQPQAANLMRATFDSSVPAGSISDYERGENSPDGRRVWELLEIYGVKYDQQPAAPRPEVTLASAVELLHEIRDDVKSLRMRRKISRLEEGRGKQAL